MDFLTVTKLTDPIEHRIPTGKAEEVAGEPTWLDAVDALICRELMSSDAVPNIPTAEAREVMPPTAQRIVCKNIGEAFGEMIRRDLREGILRDLFGDSQKPKAKKEDPNAAMIARDEPDWGRLAVHSFDLADAPCRVEVPFKCSRDLCSVVVWASDDGITFSRLERKPGVKPAITGLTTVNDGKERGLGFCCE